MNVTTRFKNAQILAKGITAQSLQQSKEAKEPQNALETRVQTTLTYEPKVDFNEKDGGSVNGRKKAAAGSSENNIPSISDDFDLSDYMTHENNGTLYPIQERNSFGLITEELSLQYSNGVLFSATKTCNTYADDGRTLLKSSSIIEQYDEQGNKISTRLYDVTYSDGYKQSSIDVSYDGNGVMRTRDTETYGRYGKLEQHVSEHFDSNNGELSSKTTENYDKKGNLTSSSEEIHYNWGVETKFYDANGNITRIERVNNKTEHFSGSKTVQNYDAKGNLISEEYYDYNTGNITGITNYYSNGIEASEISFEYDESGKLAKKTTTEFYESGNKKSEIVETYENGTLSYKTTTTYPDSTGGYLHSTSESYESYNKYGDYNERHTRTYDENGKLISEIFEDYSDGELSYRTTKFYKEGSNTIVTKEVSESFDVDGKSITTIEYDEDGNRLSMESLEYYPSGAIKSKTLGTYNQNGTNTSLKHVNYDEAGVVTSESLTTYSDGHTITGRTEKQYTNGQLSKETTYSYKVNSQGINIMVKRVTVTYSGNKKTTVTETYDPETGKLKKRTTKTSRTTLTTIAQPTVIKLGDKAKIVTDKIQTSVQQGFRQK